MTPRTVGRYEIEELLGRGGMASVHLARQPALGREVALKELHSVHVADAALAHRFLHESRVAGGLNHPSIVSVIEYFEHEGVPFIAMEYLERGSLRPLVGRLTLAQVAGVLESVLAGLAEAAARGIVHRDLKPENVLLTADGHAKVADFGIAKAIGQVTATAYRTATGQIIGTPAYLAPEQAMGGEITPQADLYATGLIAYELLAGRHPFHDCDAPMALLMLHVNGEPQPLSELRPDLPDGVAAWVGAMLAKDPEARPDGAERAWDRLDDVLCDALGPRWRREAALPEPGATPEPFEAIDPDPPTEIGFVTVVAPAPDPEPATLVLEAPRAAITRTKRRTVSGARRGAARACGDHVRGRSGRRAERRRAGARTGRHRDADPDGHPHPHPRAHGHADGHADRDPHHHAHLHADAGRHARAHGDTHRHAGGRGDGHADRDPEPDPDGHPHPDRDATRARRRRRRRTPSPAPRPAAQAPARDPDGIGQLKSSGPIAFEAEDDPVLSLASDRPAFAPQAA